MKPRSALGWIIAGSVVLAVNLATFFLVPVACVNILVWIYAASTLLFAVIAAVLFALAARRRRSP